MRPLRQLFWGTVFVTVGLTAAIPRAHACSCAQPGTPAEERDRVAAVFEGFVLGSVVDDRAALRVVQFQVIRSWKGVDADTVVQVETGNSDASCGIGVQDGGLMLVYATNVTGPLKMGLCSRTRPSALVEEDFTALGTPVQMGVLPAGALHGTGGAGGSMSPGAAGGATGTGGPVHSDGCAVAGGRPSAAAAGLAVVLALATAFRWRRLRRAAHNSPGS